MLRDGLDLFSKSATPTQALAPIDGWATATGKRTCSICIFIGMHGAQKGPWNANGRFHQFMPHTNLQGGAIPAQARAPNDGWATATGKPNRSDKATQTR